MRNRTKWPGDKRANILRSLEAARRRHVRGELIAIYKKYGITPQHEAQWIRARTAAQANQA
jgi:hypothetical protein